VAVGVQLAVVVLVVCYQALVLRLMPIQFTLLPLALAALVQQLKDKELAVQILCLA
jgi:hypothetical protein